MLWLVVGWFLCSIAVAQGAPGTPFVSNGGAVVPRTISTSISQLSAGSSGSPSYRIVFQPSDWPTVIWHAPEGASWNWTDSPVIAFDVTNPGSEAVDLKARIDDSDHIQFAPKLVDTYSCQVVIQPGATQTVFIDLTSADNPIDHGMLAAPLLRGRTGMEQMIGSGSVDPSHIVGFLLFLANPDSVKKLIVGDFRLLPKPSSNPAQRYDAIVDKYGQFTGADWPGKVHSDVELAARGSASTSGDAAMLDPAAPKLDQYGGWSNGPLLAAKGYFATVNRNGRWWLVTPSGHLFLSFGANAVSTSNLTVVTGREKMFVDLPGPGSGDQLAQFYSPFQGVFAGPVSSGLAYNFYEANLYRSYGADFRARWISKTINRLRSWGFNTAAAWSDQDLTSSDRIAYMEVLEPPRNHHYVDVPGGHWGPMDDPFDPRFAADCADTFAERATPLKTDPWLIGYCFGNELSWGGGQSDREHYALAYGTLEQDSAASPAKSAFLALLLAKYSTVSNLNTAWGTSFGDWSRLSAAYQPPEELNSAMRKDFGAWLSAYASQYFRVVSGELKKVDPNHLLLGCRFAGFAPEEVEAASKYCDVLSFNIYGADINPQKYGFLLGLGRPCLVTEFHFGTTDRGMFGVGLVPAPSEDSRSEMYRHYVRDVVLNPAFVGCDWFEYVDEPLTGRSFDGENFGIGLVSVTDTPYSELTEAAAQIHAAAYRLRAAAPGSR